MDGIHHRRTRRRGFHPLGALAASILGSALGLGVTTVLPSAAGASAPAVSTTAAPTTTAIPPTTTMAPPVTTTTTPRRVTATTAKGRVTTTTAAPNKPTTVTTAPAGSTKQAAALPAPPAPDGAGHYAFLALDQGRPVRYDPCQPIHYTVNLAQAPASATADLHEALRRVSAATGLTFTDDGES